MWLARLEALKSGLEGRESECVRTESQANLKLNRGQCQYYRAFASGGGGGGVWARGAQVQDERKPRGGPEGPRGSNVSDGDIVYTSEQKPIVSIVSIVLTISI